MSEPGYIQVFRNGAIEAVDTYLLNRRGNIIRSIAYEREVLESVGRFLAIQRVLGVDPPLALMITLVGVNGYRMGVDVETFMDDGAPIDRDLIPIPEVIVDGYHVDPGRLLRPIFDAIWNAAGWPKSLNYDSDGNWKPHR